MSSKKITSSAIHAYWIENAAILGVFALRAQIPFADYESPTNTFLYSFLGGLILIEGMTLFQKFLVEVVYKDIPVFSQKKPDIFSKSQLAKNWITASLPVHLIGAALETVFVPTKESQNVAFNPLFFLAKLVFIRAAVDLIFYGVHRALHHPKLYALIHKKHHQHHEPDVLHTNFQFTLSDLLLETIAPLAISSALLEQAVSVTMFEKALLATYIFWYEIGLHSGKAMPTVSHFPPLSFLYALAFGKETNVEDHTNHHRYNTCHYSTGIWVDRLFGTTRDALKNKKDSLLLEEKKSHSALQCN